jgi:hypothetical protein
VRYESKPKPGSDFGRHVDDDLRPVLRNVENAAIAYGYLALERDPRPLMTALACFALQLLRGSIHPGDSNAVTVKFRSLPYVDLFAWASRIRVLNLPAGAPLESSMSVGI